MKLVEALEKAGFLIKGATETVENEVKELKGRFLVMLAALASSLSGNILAGKEVVRPDKGMIRASKGINRAGQDF